MNLIALEPPELMEMRFGEIKRVLNSFLLQIEKDDSNSLIIAATNLPELFRQRAI